MNQGFYINAHVGKKVHVICMADVVINGTLASTATDEGNKSNAPYIILRDARFQRSPTRKPTVAIIFCENILCIIPNSTEDT